MRPDGSYYGTRGRCKKGSEAGAAKEEPKSGVGPARIGKGLDRQAVGGKKEVARVKEENRLKAEKGAAKPKRKLATASEARDAWRETEKVVKSAKEEYNRVRKETKGDKSPEARKRLLTAAYALDKAERAAAKASDKFGAAAKRESRKAMTPEQRKEERDWDKNMKMYG
jgi:hypothetical protein